MVKALATGRLDGASVLIEDTAQANRLHNKALAGAPETGNTLRLHRVEAAYCMERGWLDIPGSTVIDLLRAGADEGGQHEVDHLCYNDLRERGLTVRLHGGTMQVWDRGHTTKQDPWFTTHVFPERVPIQAAGLADLGGDHVSIVDEDGMVTHYATANAAPQGDVRPPPLPAMTGTLLDDRVLVSDPAAATVLARASIGTPHGTGRILSLIEADALVRAGALDVAADLQLHARGRHDHFDATSAAYGALAAAGVLAKSGFRFGTHLRGYTADPDTVHAEWLIHCVRPDQALSWSDLSRGIRLAHGVRKTFLVAVADAPVRFIALSWFRP